MAVWAEYKHCAFSVMCGLLHRRKNMVSGFTTKMSEFQITDFFYPSQTERQQHNYNHEKGVFKYVANVSFYSLHLNSLAYNQYFN